MKNTILAGIAAGTLGFVGVALAQTTSPTGNTAAPPAVTMPQPTLRTPADQTAGTNASGLATSGSGISMERARALIGTDLLGADDRKSGEIDNLLADGTGQVRAAIVEWGGFLGLGQKKAVVPIDNIRLGATTSDRARLTMTREQLEQLPAFDGDKLAEVQTRYGWTGLRTVR